MAKITVIDMGNHIRPKKLGSRVESETQTEFKVETIRHGQSHYMAGPMMDNTGSMGPKQDIIFNYHIGIPFSDQHHGHLAMGESFEEEETGRTAESATVIGFECVGDMIDHHTEPEIMTVDPTTLEKLEEAHEKIMKRIKRTIDRDLKFFTDNNDERRNEL